MADICVLSDISRLSNAPETREESKISVTRKLTDI